MKNKSRDKDHSKKRDHPVVAAILRALPDPLIFISAALGFMIAHFILVPLVGG